MEERDVEAVLRAPDRVRAHRLSDADFTAHLAALNGTPAEVLADRELMQIVLPILRADFQAIETWRLTEPARKIPCPILALGGSVAYLLLNPVTSNTGVVGASGGYGAVLRRGTGGHYVNGIFARWPAAAIGYRDAASKTRETNGLLSFKGVFVAESPVAFQAGQQTYAGNVADVDFQTVTVYTGDYADFVEQKTTGKRQGEQDIAQKKKRIAELKEFVARFGASANRSSQAQSRASRAISASASCGNRKSLTTRRTDPRRKGRWPPSSAASAPG